MFHIRYVLMEFVETERDYVKDLGSIVDVKHGCVI